MTNGFADSIVEDAALEWFGELGYAVGHGPQMAPGEPAAERERTVNSPPPLARRTSP